MTVRAQNLLSQMRGGMNVNDRMVKRLDSLLTIKSLVTLTLTGVFSYMAIVQRITQDFMTVYAVVIAFYFGTQSKKEQTGGEGENG